MADELNNPNSVPINPAPKIDEIEKLKTNIASANQNNNSNNLPAAMSGPIKPSWTDQIFIYLKNPKLIIGLIIAIIVIVIVVTIYNSTIKNVGHLSVALDQTPDSLTINDQNYDAASELDLDLKPGTYTVKASKNNFFPVQSTISVNPQETTSLSLAFSPYPTPTKVIDFPTSHAHLAASQQEISYLSNFGTTFYRVSLSDLTKDVISPNTFNDIEAINWAPSARQACIITSVNNNTQTDFQTKNILYQTSRPPKSTIYHLYDFSKYDLTSQTLITYPDKIKNPSWHPNKEEIIYHYIDPETGENSLSKSKPNLDNKELIYDLTGFNHAIVKYSPSTELIAVVDTKPTDQSVSNIYIFDTISRQFSKIPTKDVYVDFLWSPDSQYLVGIKKNQATTLLDVQTQATTDLPFFANINHLAWLHNSTQIIASISSPNSSDQLILYDLVSTEPTNLVYNSSTPFDTITNLIVSNDDTTLYFIANSNQHLFSLPIATMPTTDTEIIGQ
ncbi:MAG: PEGA domain-containing protein [Patescibacteria group bacterium]